MIVIVIDNVSFFVCFLSDALLNEVHKLRELAETLPETEGKLQASEIFMRHFHRHSGTFYSLTTCLSTVGQTLEAIA